VENIRRGIIRPIFDNILQQQLAHVNREDLLGVEINHISLNQRVLVPFTSAETMCAEKILSVIERIQQSNQEFKFDRDMKMKLGIVNNPRCGKHQCDATTTRIVNWG